MARRRCCTAHGIPTIWTIHESFDIDHWLSANHGGSHWHPYLRASDWWQPWALPTAWSSRPKPPAGCRGLRRCIPAPGGHAIGVDTDAIADYVRTFDCLAARSARSIPRDAVVLLSVGTLEEQENPKPASSRPSPRWPRSIPTPSWSSWANRPSPYSASCTPRPGCRLGGPDPVRSHNQ